MKSLLICVSVICGVVQASPGILDFFSGPPHAHVQTVYVVKPSHGGSSHSHHGWKSHQPTKTIVKYVTKPSPSSYFSSFFSKPFSSSGGWSSGPSSFSYSKRKPGKKPTSMIVTEEEYKARLKAKEEDDERPMPQMEMLREMEAEDPNSQVEVVGNSRPSNFREMRRPPQMRGKPRPPMVMMSMQGEDFGMEENESPMMMEMVKGRGTSKPSSSKPSKGSGSSSSGGWSSGGPSTKTVTYVSSGPSSSSGWGWEQPSSHGWSSGGPSYFSGWGGDDDEWSFGDGWSSDSGSTSGQEEEGEEGTTEAATSTTAAPPSQMVDEVGTTEEGEDRRRPAPRRPGSAERNAALTSAGTPMQGNRPRTNEPQPETPAENPRPVYGPPGQQQAQTVYGPPGQQQAQNPLGSIENPVAGISTELKLGNQVISNNDGLLDEELLRTVQQIIQTFDKN